MELSQGPMNLIRRLYKGCSELKEEYWKEKSTSVVQEEEEAKGEEEEEGESSKRTKVSQPSISQPFASTSSLPLPTDFSSLYQSIEHLHQVTRNEAKQDTTNLSHLPTDMIELFIYRFDALAKGINIVHQQMNPGTPPLVPPYSLSSSKPSYQTTPPPSQTTVATETHKSLAPDMAGPSKVVPSSPPTDLGPNLDYGTKDISGGVSSAAPELEANTTAATLEGDAQPESTLLIAQKEMDIDAFISSFTIPLVQLAENLERAIVTWGSVPPKQSHEEQVQASIARLNALFASPPAYQFIPPSPTAQRRAYI